MVANLYRGFEELPAALRGGAVSIGNFDGVHRGHALLVAELKRLADAVGGPAVVLTFDPHPASLLRPERPLPRLTTIERRAELLASLGVAATVVCPVDRDLLRMHAEAFFERTLVEALAARGVVEGPNFFFGRNREGDIEKLGELCGRRGMQLRVVAAAAEAGEMVSSTRVRALIAAGEVAAANAMLTSPYRVCGVVGHGAARGQQLGFPTANLEATETLLPGPGVYAGRVAWGQVSHAAAINIGPNPTFAEAEGKVEVHLLDFAGDLYGERLQVDFIDRVRDIHRFASVDRLREQLREDIDRVRRRVAAEPD